MYNYYQCVSFYPPEYFPDGVHPGGEYGTREKLNAFIIDLQNKYNELTDIVFIS